MNSIRLLLFKVYPFIGSFWFSKRNILATISILKPIKTANIIFSVSPVAGNELLSTFSFVSVLVG